MTAVDEQAKDERVSDDGAGAERRDDLVPEFVGSHPDYYRRQFKRIGDRTGLSWSARVQTFNVAAALLGPIWFGMRGLWSRGLPLLVLETVAFIQLARGLFGDLGADARERIEQIESTLAFRQEQLQSAIDKQSDKVDVFKRAIASLESAISDIEVEAAQADATVLWVTLSGLGLLLLARLIAGFVATPTLEKRFSAWMSDRRVTSGISTTRTALTVLFVLLVILASTTHYAFPGAVAWLGSFPTDARIRLGAISVVEQGFDFVKTYGRQVFEMISLGIRVMLDGLEVVFVETPWPVIAAFIILLTWLSAGVGAAVASALFLSYMGLFGFWEKAMTTLALLGTAALLSISLGIPLGLFSARRPRFYAVIRPIMDFMQTMPSFVFMIPVIAFFSVGKPAAVITTMIFGGTPVVRLTVLGMRGVPDSIREAAIAFGASKWYLLTRVDLPLAAPSILAGVNQTIMLSLAMVVVASLIGAKGLGEDVLEALQYSSVGQGILAGFAILFCAMILNRVVQGKRE